MGSAWTESVEYTPYQHFQFEHFPRPKINFKGIYLLKFYKIVVNQILGGLFTNIFKKNLKKFPLYFQILLLQWEDFVLETPWVI